MAKVILNNPFDLPKTYYRAIGEVVARSALFEHHLMLAIGQLLRLKDPKQVRVSFMGMAAKARLGALQGLANNWAPDVRMKQEINSIAKEARKLALVRNSFAHGVWGYPESSSRTLYVSYAEEGRDFYLPKAKRYKSSEIVTKAAEIRALNKRLWMVVKQLKAVPSP